MARALLFRLVGVLQAVGEASWLPPTSSFNRLGLATPFNMLQKHQQQQQPLSANPNVKVAAAGGGVHVSGQRADVNTEEIMPFHGVEKIVWLQTTGEVVVTLYVDKVVPSKLDVTLSSSYAELNMTDRGLIRIELLHDILPGKSSWAVQATGVQLKLAKRSKQHWAELASRIQPAEIVPLREPGNNGAKGGKRGLWPMQVGQTGVILMGPTEPNSQWLVGRSQQVAAAMAGLQGRCAARSFGWWSYSVCHFDKITQWHPTSMSSG